MLVTLQKRYTVWVQAIDLIMKEHRNMAGKERYKREIAMLFPYMSKKEKMF